LHISLKAEELYRISGFPITNSLLLTVIIAAFLIAWSYWFKKKLEFVPKGLQNLLEAALESMLELMDAVLGNRKKSEQYLPLVATIFSFVLLANWSGLIPGLNALTIEKEDGATYIFRAPSSDLNFTLALAIVTVFAVNLLAIASLGAKVHLAKFLNFRSPIGFFVGAIEFISEIAKMISFSFRLFGNIFAGEVLLVIVAFLVPYLIPLPFILLEIFVGFIQAFIFAMLTLVFIGIATAEQH